MAKSSKKSKEPGASDPAPNHQNGDGAAQPVKAPPLKGTSSKAAKSKLPAKARANKPRKTAAPRRSRAAAASQGKGGISDEEVRIRAYFISQDRMREGRPGTSSDDWLEARRQLEAEGNRGA